MVSKHFLRLHDPSASAGNDLVYSVEYIRSNCLKAVSPEPAEDEDSEEAAAEDEGSDKDSAEAYANAEARKKEEAKAKAAVARAKKEKEIAKAKAKAKAEAKPKPVAEAAEEQRVEIIAVPSVFDWLSPFLNSDKIEVDLLLLESRPALNSDDSFFGYYLALLKRLRFGQGAMYSAATKFQQYYEQQVGALASYPNGPVALDDGKKRAFIDSMDTNRGGSFKIEVPPPTYLYFEGTSGGVPLWRTYLESGVITGLH